jgi:quinol monooxygenase YgiN
MIYEVAELNIKPDTHDAFQAAVAQAAPLFKQAKGCLSMRLDRNHEVPDSYHLVVGWETIANHMVDFRNSPAFQTWRGLVGDYFAQAPKVEHFSTVVNGF